jgi:hypothetical protein
MGLAKPFTGRRFGKLTLQMSEGGNGSGRKATWQTVVILVAAVGIAVAIGWIIRAVGEILQSISVR